MVEPAICLHYESRYWDRLFGMSIPNQLLKYSSEA